MLGTVRAEMSFYLEKNLVGGRGNMSLFKKENLLLLSLFLLFFVKILGRKVI